MSFDLLTLYSLAVGTLLLSAGMTLWECHARPRRSSELRILAGGYTALAMACVFATWRSQFPGALGAALSNLTFLVGYLLILEGVAGLNGHRHRARSFGLLLAMAIVWAVAGGRWQESLWIHVSSAPIAIASGLTAWEMLRSERMRALQWRSVIMAVTGVHGAFYLGRAVLLPVLSWWFGPEAVQLAAKITMYEGVLYSVALPMALLALIREEAHDQLLHTSRTDYLTGLANRRWFFDHAEAQIGQAGTHAPISLLAFDLDHFKAINDRYGHATGDEVLRLFGRVAREVLGETALLARLGGEEFVALLPGRARPQARETGQAVAGAFAAAVASKIAVEATVSVGLAEYGTDGSALSDLLSAADRALYSAKARGRNRIELASPMQFVAVG